MVLAQTLVRNLVANAVRFARTRVVVSAVAVAEGVRVTVSDDGPGLPPEISAVLADDEGAKARSDLRSGGLGLRFCVESSRYAAITPTVATMNSAELVKDTPPSPNETRSVIWNWWIGSTLFGSANWVPSGSRLHSSSSSSSGTRIAAVGGGFARFISAVERTMLSTPAANPTISITSISQGLVPSHRSSR